MPINLADYAEDVTPRRRMQPYTLAELSGRPRRQYLVKGLIDQGAMSAIIGEAGCTKTFFAIDLAFHVALGRDWFGCPVHGGAVYYLAAEGGFGIEARIAAWKQYYGLAEDPPLFVYPGDAALTGKDTDTDALINEIQRIGQPVVLVEIDTMSRVFNGENENAPDAMGGFVSSCDRIRTATGAHVQTVHHVGKDATRGARGHSILRAAVDTEIEISRNATTGIVTAKVTKQRDREQREPVAYRLEPVEIGTDEDGDPVVSCVITATDVPAEPKATLTPTQRRAMDVLHDALIRAGKPAPAGPNYPKGATVVSVDVWRESLLKAGVIDANAKNPREPFRRIKNGLSERNAIREWDGLLWTVKEATND